MRRFILLCAAAVAMFAGLSPAASAATKTWVGGSGANWSTAANWSPSGAPIAGDLVQFNSAVTSTADLGTVAIGAVVFGANSGGSVINGTIRINAAAAPASNFEDNATGAANTINANIVLSAGRSWFKSSTLGHTLEFKGTISGDGSENGIRIYGPGTVKFNLNFDNSYVGATTVNSADANGGNGLLQIAGNAFSVIPGEFVVGTSTTASSAADRPQAQWITSQVVADGSKVTVGPDGLLVLGINNEVIAQLSGTGSITTTGTFAALTVGDAGDFTWGGVISGTGNVNKVGTGSMTYTAVNAYTGTTTVSGGTLVLDAPSRTIFGPLNIGLGVGTTTTATVRLANDYQNDNAFLPITINADGKLDTSGRSEKLGAVTMNGGHFTNADGSRIDGGLTMNGGTITAATSDPLTMRSNVVATSTGPFGAASINANVLLRNSPATFTVNSGSAQPELTINGMLTIDPGFPKNLIKTGAGTLRLAGTAANNYGGSTTIAQGTLELAKPDNVGAISGPVVIGNGADPAGSATLKSLAINQIGGNSTVQINASGKFDLNAFSQSVTSLSGVGTVSLPTPVSELRIGNPTGTTATYDGIISGLGKVTKFDPGTQIFTQNNPYTGKTLLLGGTLIINGQQSGDAFVDFGGSLSGTGKIGNATLCCEAKLLPGVTGVGGTLSAGNIAAGSGDTFVFDLTSPSVFGKLNVTGTVALSKATLSVLPAPGFTAPIGTVFEIVTNDGTDAVTGTFQGLPQGATVSAGSRNFTISYTGGTGNDITLTVAKNTPVMTLSASPNPTLPPAFGGNTTLLLAVGTVGGVEPTGTVAFVINGTPVPNCSARTLFAGVASCFLPSTSLTVGTASVTASYSGDGNYAAGSPTPLSLVVAGDTTPVLLVQLNGASFGVVTSNPTGISCAGHCSEIYPNGTVVTLTATPNAGSVFVSWGGGCIGRISPCTLTLNGPKFVTARFAPISIVGTTINIDIDGDGKYRPETDGLLITRFIQGLTGPALTAGAVALPSKGGTATRVVDADIENYLTNIFPALDVSWDGGMNNTDGVLIMRYLFGFRGAALVAGVTLGGGVTPAMVEANLQALTP